MNYEKSKLKFKINDFIDKMVGIYFKYFWNENKLISSYGNQYGIILCDFNYYNVKKFF